MLDSKRLRILAIIGALILLALVLSVATGAFDTSNLMSLVRAIFDFASTLQYSAALLLLAGAWCFAQTRNSKFLLAAIIWVLLNVMVAYFPSWFPVSPRASHPTAYIVRWIGQAIALPSLFVPFMFLLSVRFQGRLERLRHLTLLLIPSFLTAQILIVILTRWPRLQDTIFTFQTILLSALALAVAGSAWCVAFRQAPPHRPPSDASKTLFLPCPRCQNPLTITLPHGSCPHCRLQLTIALEEGACQKCHYPLRGLTGDKCPECGTPFVQPTVPF